jgi:hypothetical protein
VAAAVGINAIKPWEWFEHPKPKPRPPPSAVRLIEANVAAYAQYQWEADVRVVNETTRNIKVERVTVVFGKASYGERCDKNGNATRVLYPVLEPGRQANVFQPLQRGEGARFKGGQNIDRLFGGKRCPLAVAKLKSPQDRARSPPSRTTARHGASQRHSSTSLRRELKARVRVRVACPVSSQSR